MIVKVFARGSGGGKNVADYLMGKDRKREGAMVLRGDIEQTKEIIDSLDFSRNYTSGVLSFEEKHTALTKEQKNQIMDRFEEAIFSGLEPNQYEITWIQHTDKNERLELNFVIANVELETGKRLQPYYHKVDKNRINNCKDIINHDFSLSDPNSPEKKRNTISADDLPRNKKELTEAIHSLVKAGIDDDTVNNRDDVIKLLESRKITIARMTKQSISIKSPDGGQNIRLKGNYYEQHFKADRSTEEEHGRIAEAHKREVAREIQRVRADYRQQLERTAERNRKLYRSDINGDQESTRKIYQRDREQYREAYKRSAESTALESRAIRKEMVELDDSIDKHIGIKSDRLSSADVSSERKIGRDEDVSEIGGDLQEGSEKFSPRNVLSGEWRRVHLRRDRPEVSKRGLEKRERNFVEDNQLKKEEYDGSGTAFIEYVKRLGRAVSGRIEALKEKFGGESLRIRELERSQSHYNSENEHTSRSIEANITESNRLAEVATQNNEILEKMAVQQEKSISYGMSR